MNISLLSDSHHPMKTLRVNTLPNRKSFKLYKEINNAFEYNFDRRKYFLLTCILLLVVLFAVVVVEIHLDDKKSGFLYCLCSLGLCLIIFLVTFHKISINFFNYTRIALTLVINVFFLALIYMLIHLEKKEKFISARFDEILLSIQVSVSFSIFIQRVDLLPFIPINLGTSSCIIFKLVQYERRWETFAFIWAVFTVMLLIDCFSRDYKMKAVFSECINVNTENKILKNYLSKFCSQTVVFNYSKEVIYCSKRGFLDEKMSINELVMLDFDYISSTDIMDKVDENREKNSSFGFVGFYKDKFNKEKAVFSEKVNSKMTLFILETDDLLLSYKKEMERKYKILLKNKLCHEFKTPIIAIQSIIEETQEIENDETYERLEKIKFFSEILLLQLMDIFDYSDTNETKIKSEEIFVESLKDYIYKLATACSANFNKVVSIDYVFSKSLLSSFIQTDEMKFKQIIANLLSNSIRVTDNNNKILINVTHKENALDRASFRDILVIEFVDYKAQLSSEIVDIINDSSSLEIYSLNNSDENLLKKGLGIGILICKKLCFDLGISISCSVTDKTIFTLQLPVFGVDVTDKTEVFEESLFEIDGNKGLIDYSSSRKSLSNLSLNISDYDVSQGSRNQDKRTSGMLRNSHKLGSIKIFIDAAEDHAAEERKENNMLKIPKSNILMKSPTVRKPTYETIKSRKLTDEHIEFKILIIDDCESIIKAEGALVRLLIEENTRFPYKIAVMEMTDGIDALYEIYVDLKYNENKIKLIISDEMMEYMNGSTLCTLMNGLMKKSGKPPIPFAICSAFEGNEHNSKMVDAHVDYTISKPLTKITCHSLLKEHIYNLFGSKYN